MIMDNRSTNVSPITAKALESRRAGIAPNFDTVHTCSICGEQYLCPDRYLSLSCGPTDYCKSQGWKTEPMACLPCLARYSPEDRATWHEAHVVKTSCMSG